jgi:hypothetical protein
MFRESVKRADETDTEPTCRGCFASIEAVLPPKAASQPGLLGAVATDSAQILLPSVFPSVKRE